MAEYCGVTQVCGRNARHPGHHGGFRWPAELAPKRQPPHAQTLLTPRQYEAVIRLARGQTGQTVLREMKIARKTLDSFKLAAFERYDADGWHDLLVKLGWLVLPE